MLDGLTADLRGALSPSILVSGSAQVIDIAPLRTAREDISEKMWQSVGPRLEGILRQCLSHQDFFAQIGPTRYLVVTPRDSAEESAVICLRVLHELIVALFGRWSPDQVWIERAHEGENGTLIGQRFSVQTISHLARKTCLVPPESRPGDPPVDTALRSPSAARAAQEPKFLHRFEAVWDGPHEAVTTYMCVPHLDAGGQEGPIPSRHRVAAELSAIAAGTAELTEHLSRGSRFVLCVPLSYDLLCSPNGRMEVVSHFRALPAACRPYLLFLIREIPAGVAHARLADFVLTLGHFGHIVASFPSGARDLGPYQGVALKGLACDFGTPGLNGERVGDDIVQLVQASRNLRLIGFAFGVANRALLANLHAAGTHLIHGPLIGPPRETPQAMTRLPRAQLIPETTGLRKQA